MELDLLAAAETESDSESNHSNQDNASGRRSVVTAATAGSEAGTRFRNWMKPNKKFAWWEFHHANQCLYIVKVLGASKY